MKAVVMAGGEGTRLRPLTSNQPKPMVPIVGKPCMEHALDLLRRHGLTEVVVTLAFMPQAIRTYFGDGESLGLEMDYSVEEQPLGTAGSVALAKERLTETFLVISGDALCDVDLTGLIDAHRRNGAAVTIGLKSVDNPLEFGIVVTDDDGRVERFLEKPSWGQVFSDTINTGIYVLEPEVLRHVPDDRPFDFSKELFPLPARDGAADLRTRARRLLAGRRDARAVPAGELRRARRGRPARDPRSAPARERLGQRGRRHRPAGADRRTGVRRRQQPRGRRSVDRCVHRAHSRGDRARRGTHLAQRRRRGDVPRPQLGRRGRDPRPLVRRSRPRTDPRGRRDRRRGDHRGRGEHLPGRPDLPLQGDRDRRADPREHRLGASRREERVRPGRRHRSRQRRPHPRDRSSTLRRARHRSAPRQPRGREQRLGGRVPPDPAGR